MSDVCYAAPRPPAVRTATAEAAHPARPSDGHPQRPALPGVGARPPARRCTARRCLPRRAVLCGIACTHGVTCEERAGRLAGDTLKSPRIAAMVGSSGELLANEGQKCRNRSRCGHKLSRLERRSTPAAALYRHLSDLGASVDTGGFAGRSFWDVWRSIVPQACDLVQPEQRQGGLRSPAHVSPGNYLGGSSSGRLQEFDRRAPGSGTNSGGRLARRSVLKLAPGARIGRKLASALLCEEASLGRPGTPQTGFLKKNSACGTSLRPNPSSAISRQTSERSLPPSFGQLPW